MQHICILECKGGKNNQEKKCFQRLFSEVMIKNGWETLLWKEIQKGVHMVGWEGRNGLLGKENYENILGKFFHSFILELQKDNIHQMLIKK